MKPKKTQDTITIQTRVTKELAIEARKVLKAQDSNLTRFVREKLKKLVGMGK